MSKSDRTIIPQPPTRNQDSPHPLIGCMKGTLTIAPGVDLTEPTCPDWEAYAERKYGPNSRLGRIWAQFVERKNQGHRPE